MREDDHGAPRDGQSGQQPLDATREQFPVYTPPPPTVPSVDPKVPGGGQMLLLILIWFGITFFIAVAGAIAYSVVQLVLGVDASRLGTMDPVTLSWMTVAANSIATAVCLFIGKYWARRPWSEILPFPGFKPALLPAITLAGAGLTILLSEVDNLTRMVLPMPQFLVELMSDLLRFDVSSFVLVIIVAPITEEFLFRGLILNGLRKRHTPLTAMVISSLGFALLHLNPYQFIGGFVIGMFLGWLRLKTGSLWPCLFLHALNNAFVFFAALLPVEIPGYSVPLEGGLQPWWFDLCGLVLVAAGLYWSYGVMAGRVRPADSEMSGGGEDR